jgi:hypothetical protein
MVFYQSDIAAAKLKIDTRDSHFLKVRSATLTSRSWFFNKRMRNRRSHRFLPQVFLPLEKIATGPDNNLGLGPGYEAHGALDWLLQDLKRFPERGWGLIRAGLRRPIQELSDEGHVLAPRSMPL